MFYLTYSLLSSSKSTFNSALPMQAKHKIGKYTIMANVLVKWVPKKGVDKQ